MQQVKQRVGSLGNLLSLPGGVGGVQGSWEGGGTGVLFVSQFCTSTGAVKPLLVPLPIHHC